MVRVLGNQKKKDKEEKDKKIAAEEELKRIWNPEIVQDSEEIAQEKKSVAEYEDPSDQIILEEALKKFYDFCEEKGKPEYYDILFYYDGYKMTLEETAIAMGFVNEKSSEQEIQAAIERVRGRVKKARTFYEEFKEVHKLERLSDIL